MANVSFSSLKLKLNKDVKTFDFDGKTVEVMQYLPIEDKYDLIMITLQQAKEKNIYNPITLDVAFHMNLIFMYTNISFTDKQKEDIFKLYDLLYCNGIVDKVLETMNEDEYNYLYTSLQDIADDALKYGNTMPAAIRDFVESLPTNMAQAAELIDNFDPEKYQEVINFAKAVGMPSEE